MLFFFMEVQLPYSIRLYYHYQHILVLRLECVSIYIFLAFQNSTI